MNARLWGRGLLAAALLTTAGAQAAHAADTGLDAYSVPATAANIEVLRSRGFDVVEGRVGKTQEVVATAEQARTLTKLGAKATLKRGAGGQTERQKAQRGIRPGGSYDVYRPYFDDTRGAQGAAPVGLKGPLGAPSGP